MTEPNVVAWVDEYPTISREQWLNAIANDPEGVADLLENLQHFKALEIRGDEIWAGGVVVARTKGSSMSPVTTTTAGTSEVGGSTEQPT